MRKQIENYIRSGHAGLYIVSPEEARVEAELGAIAQSLGFGLLAWSVTEGLVDTRDGQNRGATDPLEALNAIAGLPGKTLVLLRDFHPFLEDSPVLIRSLKDQVRQARTANKVLIVLACRLVLPPELEREIVVLNFRLPGKEELGIVLDGICMSAGLKRPGNDARDALLDAATGLTTTEAENAFALSVAESKAILPAIVAREKAASLRKGGLLEVVDVKESLDSIGGLDQLKGWLLKRKDAFSRKAQKYGLPSPKGLLIIGIPGTGKSLTAKATAAVFGRPLLKLDAGRIFAGLVGQSEANLRSVIQTAEAIAPCVLLVDEVEKALSGSKSSGHTDGGTASRVFGSFLTWLQDKTAPVFVVMTANDVTQLPPEFLRKGRIDELFFVDLPNQEEREAIWAIQIRKYGRDPAQFDVHALARATEGLTGAEIEQAFIDALYAAFTEDREPSTLTVSLILSDLVPLSRLMGEQIQALRQWAKGRARLATTPVTASAGRKLAA